MLVHQPREEHSLGFRGDEDGDENRLQGLERRQLRLTGVQSAGVGEHSGRVRRSRIQPRHGQGHWLPHQGCPLRADPDAGEGPCRNRGGEQDLHVVVLFRPVRRVPPARDRVFYCRRGEQVPEAPGERSNLAAKRHSARGRGGPLPKVPQREGPVPGATGPNEPDVPGERDTNRAGARKQGSALAAENRRRPARGTAHQGLWYGRPRRRDCARETVRNVREAAAVLRPPLPPRRRPRRGGEGVLLAVIVPGGGVRGDDVFTAGCGRRRHDVSGELLDPRARARKTLRHGHVLLGEVVPVGEPAEMQREAEKPAVQELRGIPKADATHNVETRSGSIRGLRGAEMGAQIEAEVRDLRRRATADTRGPDDPGDVGVPAGEEARKEISRGPQATMEVQLRARRLGDRRQRQAKRALGYSGRRMNVGDSFARMY
mmetsp:Transcript_16335/g.40316  ORF Transcript_16335/g.40316 Transcript_16335/m.40316 type:complete len:430 (+) Transcript_16335:1940-3229(+)